MILRRPYQERLNADIHAQWAAGARNVLARAPTGSGKTVCMAWENATHAGASINIAHRQELVGQMSLALARNAIRHRIIGPSALAHNCVTVHMGEVGRSYYDPSALIGVGGVDTIIRRADDPWFKQVTLWQTDEAHHLLRDNKWGNAVTLFPQARGIGWTATPGRADGKGLGRGTQNAEGAWSNDGVFDAMVAGPEMRELIEAGFLTDYRIFCPPSDIDLSDVNVTGTGEFSPPKLRAAVHKSHIVGDVVATYLRIARGKLGITFAVDIEHAQEMTAAFRTAGVRAEIVTSETPDALRVSILRRFRAREIDQLVNVDLFGEGFDVPAVEVVIMARPTASFNLYAQQFGRALRPMDGKAWGVIIDHVGNVMRHGLPDAPRSWSLDRRDRRQRQEPTVTVRYCPRCTAAFERVHWKCPYCGHEPEPAGRSAPELVEGDLTELDPATLRLLRGEISRIDSPARVPSHLAGSPAGYAVQRNHLERQQTQAALRAAVALWAGWRKMLGDDDREIYRRFYVTWGVDVLTAQTLGAGEAGALTARVSEVLTAAGVAAQQA